MTTDTNMIDHNHQKKIAVINDYSGFGRCSIAVQLPIISMMRIQCCPLPTSIFSNHTGFEDFYYHDFTDSMTPYMEMWEKLHLEFKGICSGFLGSARQIDIVSDFISRFQTEDTIVIIDPVMGDYGKIYPTYTEEMCEKMRLLVKHADIVTPNLTEACILTDTPYKENWSMLELKQLAKNVSLLGAKKVVITGIPRKKDHLLNLCYETEGDGGVFHVIRIHKVGVSRSGTGDIFSAIIAGDAVNGIPLKESVRKASDFIKKCLIKATKMGIPITDGVPFEELLGQIR